MMRRFAIIGIDVFAKRILEELEGFDCEILLIDKDPEMVELYKDKVSKAFVADVINEQTITELIPDSIDGVILDLGNRIEVSILVTNYLKKRGIKNIFVRAETDEHGEILDIVGADLVVYPNREAAKKVAPMLLTSYLFNYMPISNGLVMAEVQVPEDMIGKSLKETDIRRVHHLNVVAVRKENNSEGFSFIDPDYHISSDDVLLLAGSEENIKGFALPSKGSSSFTNFFNKLKKK